LSSTVDESSAKHFRDIVIVGGGCYGSFYAGQLERARDKGAVSYRRLLVVDRDPGCKLGVENAREPIPERHLIVREWGAFFDDYLASSQPDTAVERDAIVPSPLMPHLMYEWLLRRARARWPGRVVESRPVELPAGTPYDVLAPDGTRYVSFADWLCPTHCVEPALCPVIRAPRSWEMSDALGDLVGRLARSRPTAGPVLFVCRHQAYGVGMFDVAAVLRGAAQVDAAGAQPGEVGVVVGTVSSCHGAVSLLHLGAERGAGTVVGSIFVKAESLRNA
jgi:hypothetical protein